MADDTRTETGMSDCVDDSCREQGPQHLHSRTVSTAPTVPLTRTCPKCRSAMHRSYHDSRHPCGHTRCPGGRTEHLLWTCGCGFAETTPCADAEQIA